MKYEWDLAATGVWMRTSPELRAVCVAAAEDIAEHARAIAPVREGNYIRSITVVNASGIDRVGAIVEADDPAAAPLEFGNDSSGRGRHILRRAAEVAGYDVK